MSNSASSQELWRRKRVLEVTGLSKTSLYNMINNKAFPAPISLGLGNAKTKSKAWVSTEVNQWISDVIASAGRETLSVSR